MYTWIAKVAHFFYATFRFHGTSLQQPMILVTAPNIWHFYQSDMFGVVLMIHHIQSIQTTF